MAKHSISIFWCRTSDHFAAGNKRKYHRNCHQLASFKPVQLATHPPQVSWSDSATQKRSVVESVMLMLFPSQVHRHVAKWTVHQPRTGTCSCPSVTFPKACLLQENTHRCLPDFRYHKIVFDHLVRYGCKLCSEMNESLLRTESEVYPIRPSASER